MMIRMKHKRLLFDSFFFNSSKQDINVKRLAVKNPLIFSFGSFCSNSYEFVSHCKFHSNARNDNNSEDVLSNQKMKQKPLVQEQSSDHQTKFMNPMVRELWEQRKRYTLVDQSSEVVNFKHPSHSKTTIDYNFQCQHNFLREAYQSPGGTMRLGRVLEDLDALAGNVASKHVAGYIDEKTMLVTAAVDRIALQEIPTLENNQRLSGQVTFVGNSSMEIRVQIHEMNPSTNNNNNNDDLGKEHYWLEGYFTFVAVHSETNQPVKICPLIPESKEEKALFELGSLKAAAKKEARMKARMNNTEERMLWENRAQQLMNHAFPLLRMPSLADPNAILMVHTQLQNSMIAQPQVRNLSNKIFGGFLMRRAFELAFATCYSFGGEWPHMVEVDNITFNAPVNVGDLLQFHSKVIYSLPDGVSSSSSSPPGKNETKQQQQKQNQPLVMVEVECFVIEPENVTAKLSNRFYFTYALPTKKTCRRVLPGTLEEARRVIQRMEADDKQNGIGNECIRQYNLQ